MRSSRVTQTRDAVGKGAEAGVYPRALPLLRAPDGRPGPLLASRQVDEAQLCSRRHHLLLLAGQAAAAAAMDCRVATAVANAVGTAVGTTVAGCVVSSTVFAVQGCPVRG